MTTTPTRRLTLRRGYWCTCTTHRPDRPNPHTLATLDTDTPTQAVRWIRIALRTFGSILDDTEFERTWQWLTDGYPTMLKKLSEGEATTYTVTYRDTHIRWSARPAIFLPFAHRNGRPLPACSGAIPTDLDHITLSPDR